MREVAILGVGMTRFGELWDRSFREIGIEAGFQALVDAKLSSRDLKAFYLGNMASGSLIDQEHIAPLVIDYAGLAGHHVAASRVEAGGASGSVALHQGYLAVASGLYDFVVVGGAEKLTDVPDTTANRISSSTADQEWESVFGATLPGLWALMARRHMHDFGTRREELARFPVLAHKNAGKNPNAHYRNAITVEQVLAAGPVAEPLGVFDCAPMSDGAAALVLGPMELARQHTDTPIRIAASEVACDTMALQHRRDLTTLDATTTAVRQAFQRARRAPADVQVAEIDDAYSISALLAVEDLGFAEKGGGAKAMQEGDFEPGSRVTINPSGGLKAQAVELVRQLRGEAKERQVQGARMGLAHNVGGTGATAVVHLFERVN
jgi:acetyl-CoA C-acetyltransferase